MPADVASLRYSTHVMQNSSTLNVLIKFHLTIAARLFFFFHLSLRSFITLPAP